MKKTSPLQIALMFSFLLSLGSLLSCAHRTPEPEVVAEVAVAPTPNPERVATRIRYVYVETPDTVSAMTAPYERLEGEKRTLAGEILRVFWPLLTMMATGAVFIAVLLGEHLILNRQLERRAQLKARLNA